MTVNGVKSTIIQFSLNVFTEFGDFSDKIVIIILKGLEHATQLPLVLETRMLPQCQQDVLETGSLDWLQFMLE